MKYLIVGTAGHIDHGKSALVEALTGTNPDRLEEEKRRGITIDLGFAHLDLSDDVRAGFVDVPGHERFVKNMLAGASGVDLVLLAVAADESIKPQTREHFDICRLLGVRRGLVALTKADLVDLEVLELVTMEVQEFVAGSFLEGTPIVPVSARTGQGLDALKAELLRLGREASARAVDLPYRLPIDRAFVMKGFGVVVTGTLVAGEIQKEQEVEIFPIGRRARVRGIEVYNQPAERAVAGQRTALNLAGVEAGDLARGMALAPPDLFQATDRLDCALMLLASARPLKTRAPVHFHCGTSETIAEVVLLQGKALKPGENTYAQLRLSEPGLFLPGDAFIIRQFSPVMTIGGGTVLDSLPAKHHAADERLLEFFRASERGDEEARVEFIVRSQGEAPPATIVARTGRPPAAILSIAKTLAAKGLLKVLGDPPNLFVHPEYFQALSAKLANALEKFHAANPLVAGLPKEELRGRLGERHAGRMVLPSALVVNAILQELTGARKVEVRGEVVRRAGQEVQLSSEEQAAKDEIARAFQKAGLAAPSAREILDSLRVDRPRANKILQILLKEKTLARVTEDLIFHQNALEQLRGLIARRKQQSNRINVAVFKELTGLSRKYAIPLLEYLDRERVTRREGDERVIL
jgi:selenocysteine-specific elongation factor